MLNASLFKKLLETEIESSHILVHYLRLGATVGDKPVVATRSRNSIQVTYVNGRDSTGSALVGSCNQARFGMKPRPFDTGMGHLKPVGQMLML